MTSYLVASCGSILWSIKTWFPHATHFDGGCFLSSAGGNTQQHTHWHFILLLSCTLLCGFNLSSQGSSPKMTADSNCRYEIEWVTEYACHRDYLESHSCKLNSEQHDLSIDLTPLTASCKWILLWRNWTLGFGWIWYWWHYSNMAAWTMCVHSRRCSIQRTLWTQRRSRKLHLLPERVWRSCHPRMWQK